MALRSWKQLVYICQNLTCATQRVAVSFGKAARTCGSWRNILNEAHRSHMCRCHHVSVAATRLSGYRVRAIHSSSKSEKSSYNNYKLIHNTIVLYLYCNRVHCMYMYVTCNSYMFHVQDLYTIIIIGHDSKEDYYSLLGVPRNASQKEIKKAYYEVLPEYCILKIFCITIILLLLSFICILYS